MKEFYFRRLYRSPLPKAVLYTVDGGGFSEDLQESNIKGTLSLKPGWVKHEKKVDGVVRRTRENRAGGLDRRVEMHLYFITSGANERTNSVGQRSGSCTNPPIESRLWS